MQNYIDNFLMLNTKDFFPDGIDFYINICLLLIVAAICVFSFVFYYLRYSAATVIKKLLRHEATTSEKARTISSLGLKLTFGIKSALRGKAGYKSIIVTDDRKEYTYEEYVALQKSKGFKDKDVDFATARFYIAPNMAPHAKSIADKDLTGIFTPILTCVLMVAVFVCISLIMPEILRFITASVG